MPTPTSPPPAPSTTTRPSLTTKIEFLVFSIRNAFLTFDLDTNKHTNTHTNTHTNYFFSYDPPYSPGNKYKCI